MVLHVLILILFFDLSACQDFEPSGDYAELRAPSETSDTEMAKEKEIDAFVEKISEMEKRIDVMERENKFLRSKTYKTCSELKNSPFNESDYYHIDPDGSGMPVELYCDMENGITEVGHSTEGTHNVTFCQQDGCYSLNISYHIPMNQVEALISLSEHCEQEIKFQCKMAPLKNVFMNVNYGWWEDQAGNRKYYFDGADPTKQVCGCHSDKTCIHQSFNSTCNCDFSMMPLWTGDSGKVTNKTELPIMSFKYGGFFNQMQAAKVSIGKLKCRGKASSLNQTISTCSTLKKSGVTSNGFYLTKAAPELPVTASYCSLSSPGYKEDQLRVGEDIPIAVKKSQDESEEFYITSYSCGYNCNNYGGWGPISSWTSIESRSSENFELLQSSGKLKTKREGYVIFTLTGGSSSHLKISAGSMTGFHLQNHAHLPVMLFLKAGEYISFQATSSNAGPIKFTLKYM